MSEIVTHDVARLQSKAARVAELRKELAEIANLVQQISEEPQHFQHPTIATSAFLGCSTLRVAAGSLKDAEGHIVSTIDAIVASYPQHFAVSEADAAAACDPRA